MKIVTIIKYLFTLIGIGMFVGTFLLYKSTNAFLVEAIKADGTVVDLVQSRSGNSFTYRPVIQFNNQNGEKIEFITSSGSNPPSHRKGEKVEVLYPPDEPQKARINTFFSLWGGSLILGILGVVFFLIGAGIILVEKLSSRRDEYLKKYGVPIETELQSVELNKSLTVKGRHPFCVLTQWQNPSTSEMHVFRSKNLWFDPSNYIKSKKITVLIERNNPRKYYVDLSFLPKLAE